MNQTTTNLSGLEVTLTAHRGEGAGLLLATLTAEALEVELKRTPVQIALVIDRSGSMGGQKLDIAKAAVADFIRSLDPDDRIAVVTFDDRVDLFCGLSGPNEAIARRVVSIEAGGSTDLYGGWVLGAKVVGPGGRVILLSDGQANVGRFTDAATLSIHAALSYEKYSVTTSTIGVGRDYDEGLMAGMARAGGGAHYFAHTAEAIREAFSQERYSTGAIALERVTLQCQGQLEQIGHFWAGETKKRVFSLATLEGLEATVRYTNRATGARETYSLAVPTEFGYSEEVRLEHLLQRAAEAEGDMLKVRDPRSAGEMRERLRLLVLDILAHPSSDEQAVVVVLDRLRASMERLARLERNYEEGEAMMHRKRSMQSSHNLRERAKAFSSFDDEADMVRTHAAMAAPMAAGVPIQVDALALSVAQLDDWIRWEALPVEFRGTILVVALEDPRRGFVTRDIERRTGLRVKAVFAGLSSAEIVDLLRKA